MLEQRPLHYQRTKLLPRRARHHHYSKLKFLEKLKKHYKWIIWLVLSLYFLISNSTSSFFLLSAPFSLNKTMLPQKTTPIALRKSIQLATSSSSPVRIYIYDLPSQFNTDWLSNPRCRTHLFAAEVAIHEALLTYQGRVADPNEADFFFMPVYVSCNFSTPNGFPSLRHARPLIKEAIELVSSEFPFWNRSHGSDHVFVTSHDFGACFHPMEDMAIADGIPSFLKDSILLQTFGVKGPHVCQEAPHILIPPHVSPSLARDFPSPESSTRDIFTFFRGKIELHPKSLNGRFYSKKVRTELFKRYSSNPKFYLKRKPSDGYKTEISRSVFCLCPLGWAPWSPRLVESVLLGCIPVIIADRIELPFRDTIKWEEISLRVGENELEKLESVLDHVKKTNLTAMQRNLWDPVKRRALVFNPVIQSGDATWHVVKELGGMVDRSWRRHSTASWK